MCTKFGVDSSIRFPFRERTNRQTDVTERPTNAGGFAGVGDEMCNRTAVTGHAAQAVGRDTALTGSSSCLLRYPTRASRSNKVRSRQPHYERTVKPFKLAALKVGDFTCKIDFGAFYFCKFTPRNSNSTYYLYIIIIKTKTGFSFSSL